MQTSIRMLDCTLRDGAYLIGKKFGEQTICGIIEGLQKAKIDIIEIGFFQDDGQGEGKTVYKNSQDAKRCLSGKKEGELYSVLADYSRYSVSNLDECVGDSVDAIRACFFKHERYKVIEFCKEIINKGYKCFVQPVDILGYTDEEILELVRLINPLEPYCFSIVDTFGSMYEDDLARIFSLINHNLVEGCAIGFHSHNNLQMSSGLSQAFIRMSEGRRNAIVDTTLSGMGRGAGNTPTELIAQFLDRKYDAKYDMDEILDLIDTYMNNIRSRCSWGYSTPFFVAGENNAHVNNVSYLLEKNSIRSKDIRFILNKIGSQSRKRYDYQLLENTFLEYIDNDFDDSKERKKMQNLMKNRTVVFVAPGASINSYSEKINSYIYEKNAIVIAINFLPENIQADYIYFSNKKRFSYWKERVIKENVQLIIASNLIYEMKKMELKDVIVADFRKLIKSGWVHSDNSMLMLLRLFDDFQIEQITIAGFDGYSMLQADGYAVKEMDSIGAKKNAKELNKEIREMLEDFFENRESSYPINLLTESEFGGCFDK